MLRKLGEPRIHFAIVCASEGCPRLLNEAYVEAQLEEQLLGNTRAFFADTLKFKYQADSNTFMVSPILKWFAEDFGDTPAARLKTIAARIPDPAASKAAATGQGKLSYLDYDWGLNELP